MVGQRLILVTDLDRGDGHFLDGAAAVAPVAVRVQVTAQRGSVRLNRISSFGRQEPSVDVYRDGEIRSYHAIPDGGDAGFIALRNFPF